MTEADRQRFRALSLENGRMQFKLFKWELLKVELESLLPSNPPEADSVKQAMDRAILQRRFEEIDMAIGILHKQIEEAQDALIDFIETCYGQR